MKKNTTRMLEVTFEKSEEIIVRYRRSIDRVWCHECAHDVTTSIPEDAARVTGIDVRKIYSAIEAGSAHFAESAEGSLIVCHRSLMSTEICKENAHNS